MFGNHDLVAADPLPPALPQGSGLVLIARKQYDADFWCLCEEIQRGVQEHFCLGIVVMSLYCGWTHGDNNLVPVKTQLAPHGRTQLETRNIYVLFQPRIPEDLS